MTNTNQKNFGGNVSVAGDVILPQTKEQLIHILDEFEGGSILAVGSLHSWSDIVLIEDGDVVDLRNLNQIKPMGKPAEDGSQVFEIGAGCQIKRLLVELNKLGLTLPTLGAITEQTIAGAISTATHGSGNSSLSAYVSWMRVVLINAQGKPEIVEWSEGSPELKAARCGLGRMGIILAVRIRCVKTYAVEEKVIMRSFKDIVSILEEQKWPLQQFALIPYSFKWVVYQRRKKDWAERSNPLKRKFYRIYNALVVDRLSHWFLQKVLLRLPSEAIRRFYRIFGVSLTIPPGGGYRIDDSKEVLTLEHHLFQHLEMELFVRQDKFVDASFVMRDIISVFAGGEMTSFLRATLPIRLQKTLEGLQGKYTHHYPVACRQVRGEESLISPTGGEEQAWYTMSFFTYLSEGKRGPFYEFAGFMGRVLFDLYGARFHWGKWHPFTLENANTMYGERLEQFQALALKVDPGRVLGNRELGLKQV